MAEHVDFSMRECAASGTPLFSGVAVKAVAVGPVGMDEFAAICEERFRTPHDVFYCPPMEDWVFMTTLHGDESPRLIDLRNRDAWNADLMTAVSMGKLFRVGPDQESVRSAIEYLQTLIKKG